jgi:Family of unknown function (DUF5906)
MTDILSPDFDDEFDRIIGSRTAEQEAKAKINTAAITGKNLSVNDFYCYMAMPNSFIFIPTREIWPASSVNARIPPIVISNGAKEPETVKPSTWLATHRPVEQLTWAPGLPMLIENRVVTGGGWIDRAGSNCFNQYQAPTIKLGDRTKAGPWIEHIQKIYPDDVTHLIYWFASRVQHPEIKINHALILGGNQGIGKDTMLEPVKQAVGPWNFEEVSPQGMLRRFNGFVKSVILRISEARDLGDVNRYQFYDHMKSYTAAPPDVLKVDEKHIREHMVVNYTGVIITTNHKADGIHLPQDDRRHYVAWSEARREDFSENYWRTLWRWYEDRGYGHVAAYLTELDLSAFDPKAPPPKTEAFWDIVNASRSPEDAEIADLLDSLGNPDAVTLARLQTNANDDLGLWLKDRKNRRMIPHRLDSCDYSPERNKTVKDGLWKIGGSRQVVYAKKSLSAAERLTAIRRLTGD